MSRLNLGTHLLSPHADFVFLLVDNQHGNTASLNSTLSRGEAQAKDSHSWDRKYPLTEGGRAEDTHAERYKRTS